MHTFVFPPKLSGLTVDHIDHDGLNNQKANLRHATIFQQRQHSRKRKNATSKYKGVSWNFDRELWVAQICLNGRQTNLGRFSSELEAAKAYNRAAQKHYGIYAILNVFDIEKGGEEEHGANSEICQ